MRSRTQGFSFIEVMAAMAILSLSMVVLLESQTRSMHTVSRARMLDHAVTLATAKMTELTELAKQRGIEELRDEDKGEFDQELHPGYRWSYRVLPVPSPDFAAMLGTVSPEGESEEVTGNADLLAGPLQFIAEIWGKSIRELRVEVLWGNEKRPRSMELVTHLIKPDATTQIQQMISGFGG